MTEDHKWAIGKWIRSEKDIKQTSAVIGSVLTVKDLVDKKQLDLEYQTVFGGTLKLPAFKGQLKWNQETTCYEGRVSPAVHHVPTLQVRIHLLFACQNLILDTERIKTCPRSSGSSSSNGGNGGERTEDLYDHSLYKKQD
jgi:hypothetical protein